jgi:hypothetical protein
MSSVKLKAPLGGSVTLSSVDTATDYTLTVPAANATVITTASSANITQSMLGAGVAGTGPAFSAYINASTQSLSNATWTKLTFNAEEFDTASCFDTSNYRFTPTIAGYYQVNLSMYFDYTGSQFSNAAGAIYKNGSAFKNVSQQGWGGYGTGIVSALIYMNGTTDYLEGYAYISGGSGPTILSNSSANITFFQASLTRAA